jgi:MFS family permease
MSNPHDPYRALRHRDYRLLLAAGILSSIGGEIQAVAVGWELYDRTQNAAALGLAGLLQFLPVLLLALPAGYAADHYSRRLLFQMAQVTEAVASIGLAFLSFQQGPVFWMFACLVLGGIARAVRSPTRSSLMPQVVPAEDLGNAVTWNSSAWQFANVAGPALAGFAIHAALGRAGPTYLLAAGCSLACVFLLMPIRPRQAGAAPKLKRTMSSLLAGARFVWQNDLLLAAITLDLFAVLLGGATALLPIYATDILHASAAGYGWLRAAPAIGAVVVALWLAHRPPLQRPGRTLLLAVAGFGVATIVFGLSRVYWLSFAMLVLTGGLDNISVVVRGTLMQTLTPDEMRGRVAAVNSIFISSSNELGEFESGSAAYIFKKAAASDLGKLEPGAAAIFGAVASVVTGGVGTVRVVLGVMWIWPRLLGLGPMYKVAEQTEESAEAMPLDCTDRRPE